MSAAVVNTEPPWPDDDPGPPEPQVDQLADVDNVAGGEQFREATKMPDPAQDGASFILDAPAEVGAIWGEGAQVLWAPGEALMIAGPQGVGKTTLAGLLVKALLGLCTLVLGLPVVEFRGRILYLAMDRPRQARRSLRRQFAPEDRAVLARRLTVRPGPPAADLAAQPMLLAAMAEHYGADVVVVDSLKDAAVGLVDDAVAASYNRARQHLLATGCQLAELHHTVKRSARGDNPSSAVDSIYGSTWLTSGCGSIVMLSGEPGDPIVGFRHVKQPADEVGPFRLLHDQDSGVLSIEHGVDLVELVKAGGADGLTAKGAAQVITEKSKPGRADVEKARRKLDKLAAAGVLVSMEGTRGGGEIRTPTAYFLADRTSHDQSRDDEEPQVSGNHALFETPTDHDTPAPFTPVSKPAGQPDHAANHANHTEVNHVPHSPYKGESADVRDTPGACDE